MSQRDDTGYKSFTCNGTVELYDRVKLNSDNTIDAAGLAERDIGTAYQSRGVAGDEISIKLLTASGTHKVRVKEAVTRGAILYTEAGGEVQDTDQATAFVWGVAFETATAEDDVIEAMAAVQVDIAST